MKKDKYIKRTAKDKRRDSVRSPHRAEIMNEKQPCNILLAGVGGQGVLLASRIVSYAFFEAGYDVKQAEIHGMAQRGGSLSSHIRAGGKIYSPLIPRNSAHFLISFETMETLRYLDFLSRTSIVIINDHKISPPSVAQGLEPYPENVSELISEITKKSYLLSGQEIAEEIGDVRVANSVIIGFTASFLPVPLKVWEKVYTQTTPKKYLKLNLKAFHKGNSFKFV
ncbi:MAG: indolepyruvate oxidoreductase subunit beta [bacterium]